jgi:hypothetical protein
MRTNVKKAIVYLIGSIATALGILFGLSSCNATRTISTTSSFVQRGDTTTTITTRTVESYNAKKNL